MSAEVLTTLISGATLLVAVAAGFGWMIQRIDGVDAKAEMRTASLDVKLTSRIDTLEEKLGERIDTVEEKLGERIDTVEEKLGGRIDTVERELIEVKIAIARLEGPPPRFVTAR